MAPERSTETYAQVYNRSLTDPEGFWADQAAGIPWIVAPENILDKDQNGVWRWFSDGVLNSCHVALDQHVAAGRGDQPALIYDSPVTGEIQHFTYAQLLEKTAVIAGGLVDLGVGKGDVVVIYMPMVPETVAAMLACARIGAIHSVVFGGFAPSELAMRIDDANPRVVLAASCGIEVDRVIAYQPLLNEAIDLAEHKPDHVVMLQRQQCEATLSMPRDIDWHTWERQASPVDCVPVSATDPLYVLYTSGTTGKPKGIVRDNGGHAVALNYSMRAVYGVGIGDVYWAASDVGWVVGHSYIVYGPLFAGCTTVLYEGKPVKTPDAGAFWRVLAEHKVKSFFVAPTAFRAMRKEDPDCQLLQKYDISNLEYQFVAGERLDPPTYHWLKEHLHVPVIDHWWQTETGWSICANMAGIELLEPKAGSCSLPAPGWDLRVLDAHGQEVGPNQEGAIVIKAPLPPSAFPTVWNDHQRFEDSYWSEYPGFYLTGDGGYRDEDGYVFVMGRTDDVINVAGHRLSTGRIEEVVAEHSAIAECAVVGIADAEKGQVPVGLLLMKDGVNLDPETLQAELVQAVRNAVGPIANFKRALVVARLPKTRSGKILRQVIRKMIDGERYIVPSTIDDPAIVDELHETLSSQGWIK
ncbi:MAG: propionyl-CoA synthetase [Gammaproteobacteria bacterium]|jgi:propionyl-CoA synthetase|nr:propionyl-CoA synthetase [Gammaproteobacteria bacterium]|tara:strand:- start:16 stop:1926 length:1911 start_codon:yes stop_codon:yes gene_type:complete